ncbi:MAG: sigma-70 family RNA polymerase sigma factor [Bacteroidota bacterium]
MTHETFQKTVFAHKDGMYRLAKRLLISEDEAFDAVQNVMIRLWQMREELSQRNNIEAFAIQCIKNECLNRLKHADVVSQYRENTMQQVSDHSRQGDNTTEIIIEMIQSLPEKQKMVIQLKDVEEHSISEIAEIMELEENAVRINLMRARQKIKVQLEKLFEYEQRQF